MFRLPRVIIRPSMEANEDYLSSLCTLGSQALTKSGTNIVKYIPMVMIYTQDVPGGMCQTSGGCSLC